MLPRSLAWRFLPPLLLITLVSLFLAAWYASTTLRTFYLEETADRLLAQAEFLEPQVRALLAQGAFEDLNALCTRLGDKTETRITVIAVDGRVWTDSHEDAAIMDNHARRPEVIEALGGTVGMARRYSRTLEARLMYVATPMLDDNGQIAGVLRTSVPVTAIDEAVARIFHRVVGVSLVIALLALGTSGVFARRVNALLQQLKRGAERFARGELDFRLSIPDAEELGELANAMNSMAAELQERVQTVRRQRNELEAVLTSMDEAVLAVDTQERILKLNRVAAELLDADPAQAQGQPVDKYVKHGELQQCIDRVLATEESVEDDVELASDRGKRFLHVRGSLLQDAQGQKIGGLVVLNDVTNLRRLETARRDFVANVSHEIKTPITSIKGYTETLLDGAADDPDARERFLQILKRQADRLNAIVEDILTLSLLDTQDQEREVELQESGLRDLLVSAIMVCQPKARDKHIDIQLNCEESLRAMMNAPLLEQAVVNLLDNAVKYSDRGLEVRVSACRENGEVVVSVADHGNGIDKAHIPRLFERFYRIDKARSRTMGGTGLGLAIVKHIVLLHHGRVTVDSDIGQGSTFRLHLPSAGGSS